jgi:hypothetical protein
MTKEEEGELKDHFQGALWWHWLPNFWLVVDNKNKLSCDSITNEIHRIDPSVSAFVAEVKAGDWRAIVPGNETKRIKSWLLESWFDPN